MKIKIKPNLKKVNKTQFIKATLFIIPLAILVFGIHQILSLKNRTETLLTQKGGVEKVLEETKEKFSLPGQAANIESD